MYLKTLHIEVAGKNIRSVPFRRGLNLIVDVTPKEQRSASGNNVGKTTALRCVDYCFEADPKALYYDREWKTPNREVLAFLESAKPTFVLELEGTDGRLCRIRRTFGDKERILNGAVLTPDKMELELRTLLFRTEGEKPSLRELMGKFIRLSAPAKQNTMKWLHEATGQAEYDIVWLTLFGFPLSTVLNQRRAAQKKLKALQAKNREILLIAKSPRQARKIVARDLDAACLQLRELSVAEAHEKDLHRIQQLRLMITEASVELAEAESRVANANRTLEQLRDSTPSVAPSSIREIYEDARRFISELHVSFEQLYVFHNAMLKNKATFTRRSAARWEQRVAGLREKLHELAREEAEVLRSFSSPDIRTDVQRLNDEIVRLSKRQGYLEGLEAELRDVTASIRLERATILDADTSIDAERETMEAHLEGFNEYFAEFSRRLCDRSYYLTLKLEDAKGGEHKVVPSLDNTEGHKGSGKKRTEIAAFDLAYLRWQQARNSKAIRFTLHDEIELIHGNQLATLFEIADGIDGQLVVSILSDRLSSVPFTEADKCTVLTLSEKDRFFHIE